MTVMTATEKSAPPEATKANRTLKESGKSYSLSKLTLCSGTKIVE